MGSRSFFAVVAACAVWAAVAEAQWQPLFGDGGLAPAAPSPMPSASPVRPVPPPASSGGWMPLDTGVTPSPPAPGVTATPAPPAGAASPGPATPAPASGGASGTVEIRYSGQAAADPRTASMVLRISGNQVTADVHINGVCEQNIHLGGADLTLTGTLSGPWEDKKSSIDGGWTGVDHFCGTDEPNAGQFKYFLKDEGRAVLHLRITGKRGQYGWNFSPTGQVYATGTPAAGGAALAGFGGPFDSPLGPPGAGYRTGAQMPQSYASQSGDRLRELFTGGTIALQVGDSHVQSLPPRDSVRTTYEPNSDRVGSSTDPCVSSPDFTLFMDPSSIATAAPAGSAVKVTARAKGKGELWVGGRATCTRSDGSTYDVRTILIYIVLIGDDAIADYRRQQGRGTPPPSGPAPDIKRAVVTGVARLRNWNEAVGDAIVTLVTKEGGAIHRDPWKTQANGAFEIVAEGILSGRYEVLVQKLGYGPVPGRCQADPAEPPGIGVACDLWPVKKAYVELSVDAPNASVGTIEVDFLRNLNQASERKAEPASAAKPKQRFK